MAKILIVYFSRSGENYVDGDIKSIAKGNTERVAEFVQNAVGGELFKVEPAEPYPEDYNACLDKAKQELYANARPEIKAFPEDFDSYDTIFVGYPNWWGTMPMCMFTLLEKFDLNGKTLIPFCTNEGSGMAFSAHDLKQICLGAVVKNGISVHGADAENSEAKVAEWAKEALK
ncbi:MAG: NAD(P)H-dependent oxidoreductase [Oscillospiraceae bacterium]|nr:NAD(P)H-dependent oxidoreductase [Oscillospiraceae bacterium]